MKICAITTYYNLTKSKRKLANYHLFAKNIPFFLITVELAAKPDDYELDSGCADVYVRTTSRDLLWHKESLLNVALNHIPEEFIYIAWIDCDVIFMNESLEDEICAKLRSHNLIQLFSRMYDMSATENEMPTQISNVSGYGISYLTANDVVFENSLKPKDTMDMRKSLFGLAWSAHKSIIQKQGFYDACIAGSGDRALYCAAAGQYNVTKTNLHLSKVRYDHYVGWAEKFNSDIDGKISYIDGLIIHLYHGEIANRQYKERHMAFSELEFNPNTDLKRLESGSLEWGNNSETYNNFFLNYFTGRKEM
jgi:hypothetical protein